MAISTEVAKVSGAVRCTPRGRNLGDYPIIIRETSHFTISELIADTKAHYLQERKKLQEKLRPKHSLR